MIDDSSKPVDIKKIGIYYMAATLFNKGISFLTIPIFTRLLSTSDYGVVNTYSAWESIIGMFVGCALYMGLRMAFIDYREKVDDFLSVIVTFTLFLCLLGILAWTLIYVCFHPSTSFTLGLICLIHGTSTMVVEDYSMYLQMKYHYKARTMLLILPNILSVAMSVILISYLLHDNLYIGRIIPMAMVRLVTAIGVLYLTYNRSKLIFQRDYLSYALVISLPLVFHGIALSVLSQSDRIMLTNLSGSAKAGVYSLIYNYGMAATVVTTGFDGAWSPWLLRRMKDHKYQEINETARDYAALISYAMVGIVLIGPEIVKILASEAYWEGIKIIPAIVLANYIIYAYGFYVSVEHFHKKTSHTAVNTIVAAVSNLALNFLFIPRFGYIAAAYTTVASYLLCFILHFCYAKKLEKEAFPLFKTFLLPFLQIMFSMIVFYIWMENAWVRWGILIGYSCLLALLNKKKIWKYLPKRFE